MDLQTLINEYNATELQQAARLRAIFALVKARKGYRHILFNQGGDMLNNCWDLPDKMDGPTFLDKYNREISEVVPGEE
jgi:hypothetical protein